MALKSWYKIVNPERIAAKADRWTPPKERPPRSSGGVCSSGGLDDDVETS